MTTTEAAAGAVAAMAAGAEARHFLTLDALDAEGLSLVLALSARAKREPAAFRGAIPGGKVGLIFDKPSTRTRVSLEGAAFGLGMLPIALRSEELQLGRGETIADTGRVLSRYVSAVTVRTFAQATVEELAAASTIPIVNALTDEHHPLQALADVMTLEEEFGTLGGLRVAFVGDGDNVCHSLAQAAALAGFQFIVATPPGYEPDAAIVAEAQRVAVASGGAIELTHDPAAAVEGVDAVYTDVWTSMGREDEQVARREAFAPFRVDAALMARAARHAIFLHCLPAHRGEEVTNAVIDGGQSRVWDQAENRLHTALALLYTLITGDAAGDRVG